MRSLIAGAGAIGGYIGALMARAGQDVTLYARGAHLRAMQERGLRILSADSDFEVHPRVIGDLKDAGPMDVIFLGVKAHGLTQLAPQLQPLSIAPFPSMSTNPRVALPVTNAPAPFEAVLLKNVDELTWSESLMSSAPPRLAALLLIKSTELRPTEPSA